MTEMTGFSNALENPEAANAAISAALAPTTTALPIIGQPGLVHLTLPGGLVLPDGRVLREVEVQELNGAHEERIAKAQIAGSLSRFISVLLECGVVSIEGEPATPALLKRMFIGDRDYLILGIRKATYGDDLEFSELECPHCGDKVDVSVTVDEIPVRELSDPSLDGEFWIGLSKGRKAQVRLANGEVQEELLANPSLSIPEQNTILLGRTVKTIVDASGHEHEVARNPSMIRDGLSIPDRAKLVREVTDRQPGPRYRDVTFNHDSCGKEVSLPIDLGVLFRDL